MHLSTACSRRIHIDITSEEIQGFQMTRARSFHF